MVDVRYGKTTYQLEFELFVTGEHAFRITPEDDACEGCQIDRSVVRVEETFTTADGKMLKYIAQCLKPKEGKTLKPYTKSVS